MTETHNHTYPLIESIAGFAAGITSTLVSHPLDVIKTRLQGSACTLLIRND